MADLVFNELSTVPECNEKTEIYDRLKKFCKTFNISKNYNFNRIRFDTPFDQIVLSKDYTLNDFCCENRTLGTLLLGISRYPFIDDNSIQEEQYIKNNFFIVKDDRKIEVYGLAAAYLYSTIGIGFCPDEYWTKLEHTLKIIGEQNVTTTILCVSEPDHFESKSFNEWFENNREIELVESAIPVEEKKISLRDDHGKDILLKFSNKIIQSPYVVKIINSIPFNPANRKFIHKIHTNGNIEIVLPNTDEGLGLVLESTGRNIRETEAIADILKEQYE